MSLWKNYLLNRIIHENHPSLNRKSCLNNMQNRHPCHICRKVCPNGVFDEDEPAWELCDNCHVCVSACPTRCIAPAALTSAKLLESCSHLSDKVSLSCQKYEGNTDLSAPCLASYPWEMLAFFAISGKTEIYCGDCNNCSLSKLYPLFEETCRELKAFLGEERMHRSISFSKENRNAARVMSRRESFAVLFSKSKASIAGLLPAADTLIPDGSLWRQLLFHRLEQLPGTVSCNFLIPSITEKCSLCNLCTKLCPTHALHRIQDKQDSEIWHLALIPRRCTGCGLCSQICKEKAMTAPQYHPLRQSAQPQIFSRKMCKCERCGEPAVQLSSSGLCPLCEGEVGPKQYL